MEGEFEGGGIRGVLVWLETPLAKEDGYHTAAILDYQSFVVVNRRFALCGRSVIVYLGREGDARKDAKVS